MGGKGSGGQNRLPADVHRRRGTWRRERHAEPDVPAPAQPPPPDLLASLGKTGADFYGAVLARYDLTEGELLVLAMAARAIDHLHRLDARLTSTPDLIPGSRGQALVNPLFEELRKQQAALGALLAQLHIEAPAASEPVADVIPISRWQREHRRP